ncbi:MAG: alpha/beta hydrolase [Confluentimicrobium sp.]|uniref:alpha/beta fold hydrolase n=1 Tax=Actibacterium sp. TaxID=1872125 RepID=UPI000C5870D0|nr:alpha/beta hydrolase [Actibacterium sp.]MBC55645.1 alpha/beta hydrolase [Actibacterium sp.]|tara:strand:+ start:7886 stop:8767 length:882 start_codon:yes stop_codon:yes gene_type:complete
MTKAEIALFAGFEKIDVDVPGAMIHARVGGKGAPLLLLHGYPQTHVMWHVIAEELAKSYRVVAADLRGYGDSITHDGDFTFRAMARDQVALMRHMGYSSFHVVSHDRGARTAHRMVLDHTGIVRSVALIDILPTLDVWRTMDAWLARRYYHWLFLAQPGDMPQRLVNCDPILFLHSALIGLSGAKELFEEKALAEYERAARNPSVVGAWCGDYTAAATIDLEHDQADLGRTSDIPSLVLWGRRGVVAHHLDPLEAWRAWFPNADGHAVDAGHFLVEERPAEVLQSLAAHLKRL